MVRNSFFRLDIVVMFVLCACVLIPNNVVYKLAQAWQARSVIP